MNRLLALGDMRPTAVIITVVMLAIIGWLALTQTANANLAGCNISPDIPSSNGTLVTAFAEADCLPPNDHQHVLNVRLMIARDFQPDDEVANDSASGTDHIEEDASGCDGGKDTYYTAADIEGQDPEQQSARRDWMC